MNINVIYNNRIPDFEKALREVENELSRQKAVYKAFDINEMQNWGDLTITLGGDGTILRTARFYAEYKTPVLGINLGRLGFLSQPESIPEIVKAVVNKNFYTEERIMLNSSGHIALNDIVIKGCDTSRTSKFYLEINGKEVCDYIADGIIISTPTGSTAYCLSAGGPVVYPAIDALVVVPICPHTLNVRPLVIPSGEKIVIKTTDKLLSAAIDGYDRIKCVEQVSVELYEKKAILAFLKERQFYSVIRKKLHWGISPEESY